jgi:hypothetical protein
MAAKAVSLSPERIAWWDRFQNLAELRIAESNLLSGECLWQIVKSQDGGVLLIQSTRHPGDFLECSADLQAAILRCRPAPALESSGLVFCVQQEGDCTVEQALHQILDQLVWREDGGYETERAR